MEFLKKYTSHEEYEVDKTPNVSLCVENNEKHLHYTKKKFDDEYLTFEALESGTFTLTIGSAVTTGDVVSVSYSLDNGETWTTTNNIQGQKVTITTPTVNAGDEVLWKGNAVRMANNSNENSASTFSSTANFNARGNVMSLLYGDEFKDEVSLNGKNCCFYNLFRSNTKLNNGKNISLPATTLAYHCYGEMFYGCTSLTVAPELPATTLANNCYSMMFKGCTSLITTPELPATTLKSGCYSMMFDTCTSLTTAPELPATILAENCYGYMFYSCSGLTTAPELPAATLKSQCYCYMFRGCKSLTTAPELPATTLANNCYQYMFNGCTSLTAAPELPATTLTNYCYNGMFYGCTSLTTAPELPATTLASSCYNSMFEGCTSLTTAPELPATTLANYCYQGMFYGCTNLSTAPSILPGTTLTDNCYGYMFYGCTSLTTAPELPATTLVNYCYYAMFSGCTNLNSITCLATENSTNTTNRWTYNVASRGVFIGNEEMVWKEGCNGVPKGWVTNVQLSPSYDSNETIRIWVDDFSCGEEYILENGWDSINKYFDDYFENPSGFGGKPYEYTGEMIEWNGNDYYIWVFNEDAVEDNDLPDNCKYILTETIDLEELNEMSVNYNYNNRICPYIAMITEDLTATYEEGQDSDRFLVLVEDIS